MPAARTRSVAIDLVRVVAVVAVVLRHTWYDPEKPIAQIVCPWAIAIFFVLSGYLWSKRRDVAAEARHRAAGLLVPYAVWVPLISIPYFIWAYQEFSASWATWLLMGVGYGGSFMVVPFSACWFFTVMFFTVVLLRWLERYPRWITWAVLAVTVVLTIVAPVVFRYGPLGMFLAFPCLFLLVMGQELRRFRPRITHPLISGIVLLAVGVFAALFGAAHDLSGELIEIKQATFGFPVLGLLTGVVISYGFVLIAESLDPRLPDSAGPLVVRAAGTATFVMFLHPCILFILGTTWSGSYRDFALALLVPFVLAVICQQRGWLPWLTGDQASCAALVDWVLRHLPVVGRRFAPAGADGPAAVSTAPGTSA